MHERRCGEFELLLGTSTSASEAAWFLADDIWNRPEQKAGKMKEKRSKKLQLNKKLEGWELAKKLLSEPLKTEAIYGEKSGTLKFLGKCPACGGDHTEAVPSEIFEGCVVLRCPATNQPVFVVYS